MKSQIIMVIQHILYIYLYRNKHFYYIMMGPTCFCKCLQLS